MKRDVYYLTIICLLVFLCVALFFGNSKHPLGRDISVRIPEGGTAGTSFAAMAANEFPTLNENMGRTNFPIQYDKELAEYQLVFTYTEGTDQVTSRMPIKFCPWTGKPFPESKRKTRFTQPSSGDTQSIQDRLKHVATLSDVRSVLGKPDDVVGPFGDVKAQWTYDNVSQSVNVIVQEMTDGTIAVLYSGKMKQKPAGRP